MPSPSERYAAARQRAARPVLADFRGGYPFALDDFQVEACEALESGYSVLVCAPTGAGKTVVGEFAVHLALAAGQKCFYTTPIKALSNQKYNDLVERYGAEQVGLLTGDNAVNADAPVVVMTTEVLRNMLYVGSAALADLGYVVMDEVHYLGDRFRGAVWEEVIIHLPAAVRLVSLSATVSNAEEFGEWLQSVRGETQVIVHEQRPVPLWQHVLVGTRMFDLFGGDGTTLDAALLRHVADRTRYLDPIPDRRGGRPPRGLAPAAPARRHRPPRPRRAAAGDHVHLQPRRLRRGGPAVRAGRDVADHRGRAGRDRRGRRRADRRHVAPEDLDVLGYWEWRDALRRGVAAHHAGLIPPFKQTVEELFVRGLVRAVFATETLALGINMPARTVVLERLTKFNGETHADITPGEYTQLTGRAGRRGIDVEGHAVVVWGPEVDPQRVAGLASTRTYPLRSSFRPSYNMAVNLVGQMGRPAARHLLESSFAQFQADRAVAGLANQIRRNEETLRQYAEQMQLPSGRLRRVRRAAPPARASARPRWPARGRGPGAGRWPRRSRRCAAATSSGCRAGGAPGWPSSSTRACSRTTIRARWWSPRRAGRAGCRSSTSRPPSTCSAPCGSARTSTTARRRSGATSRPACARWTSPTTPRTRRGRRGTTGDGRRGAAAAPRPARASVPPVRRPRAARALGRAARPARARERRAAPAHRGPHRIARPHLRPDLRAARRPRVPGRRRDDAGRPAAGPHLVRGRPAGRRVPARRRVGRAGRRPSWPRSCRRLVYEPRRDETMVDRMPTDAVRDALADHGARLGRSRRRRGRARPAAQPRAAARLRLGGVPLGPAGAARPRAVAAASNRGNELSAGDFIRWCKQVLDLLDQLADRARSATAEPPPVARDGPRRGRRRAPRGRRAEHAAVAPTPLPHPSGRILGQKSTTPMGKRGVGPCGMASCCR